MFLLNCFQNYAEKICEENNLTYYYNSIHKVECKKDIRKTETIDFLFTEEEKFICRMVE